MSLCCFELLTFWNVQFDTEYSFPLACTCSEFQAIPIQRIRIYLSRITCLPTCIYVFNACLIHLNIQPPTKRKLIPKQTSNNSRYAQFASTYDYNCVTSTVPSQQQVLKQHLQLCLEFFIRQSFPIHPIDMVSEFLCRLWTFEFETM